MVNETLKDCPPAVTYNGLLGPANLPKNVVAGLVKHHVVTLKDVIDAQASKDPARIEDNLARIVPEGKRWEFATRLGWHGRRICVARKPRCPECGLSAVCPKVGV